MPQRLNVAGGLEDCAHAALCRLDLVERRRVPVGTHGPRAATPAGSARDERRAPLAAGSTAIVATTGTPSSAASRDDRA